jgi:hypothetical protein
MEGEEDKEIVSTILFRLAPILYILGNYFR